MTQAIDIFLLRHGQVDGPAALYGVTDVPSTQDGQDKVIAQLTRLHTEAALDSVFASPKLRCRVPATQVCDHLKIPLKISSDLAEIDFGIWDGIAFDTWDEHFRSRPEDAWPLLTRYYQAPLAITAPQGEALADFATRVGKEFSDIICQAQSNKYTRLAVVCHGGVIRTLLAKILGIPLSGKLFSQLQIDYASCHQLRYIPSSTFPLAVTSKTDSIFDQCRILQINSTLE